MALFAGAAVLCAFSATVRPVQAQSQPPAEKAGQTPEVKTLLGGLVVDKARVYKNMLVFPIRYEGPQAPGDWETMDKAVQAGHLKILEKAEAQVSEVQVENVGDATVFLMSGEIIKGGQQTRVIRQDTVIEAKQRASVPVFCVEPHRWIGKREFEGSRNLVPANVRSAIQGGAGQSEVWERAAEQSERAEGAERHRQPGRIAELGDRPRRISTRRTRRSAISARPKRSASPSPTRAPAASSGSRSSAGATCSRTCRTSSSRGTRWTWSSTAGGPAPESKPAVGEKEVAEFIQQALAGSSQYERTAGSGRGVDLTSGTLRGKGVSVGEMLIHLSVQETHMLGDAGQADRGRRAGHV